MGGGARDVGQNMHGGVLLGLTNEVIFGRRVAREVGVGPVLELHTWSFETLTAGAGLVVVLPIHEAAPVTLAAYPAVVFQDGGPALGAGARLCAGSRAPNLKWVVSMSFGICLEGHQQITDGPKTDVAAVALIDVVGAWMGTRWLYNVVTKNN